MQNKFEELRNIDRFICAEKYVVNQISKANYPSNHPFLEYPRTPNGFTVLNLIILKMYGIGDSIICDLIKKCKSIEHGIFNYDKFRQNANELIFLHYLISSSVINSIKILDVKYEDNHIIDNNKIPEYTLFINSDSERKYMVNIEIKTLSCESLPAGKKNDGDKYVLPYYKDQDFIRKLEKQYPDAIILEDKCCLFQLERNICKIVKKFNGNNLTEYPLFNIGVVFIDRSSSFEQFYSYLFNNSFGIFERTKFGNLDALILFSTDAKNDIIMNNIYKCGYIQTIIINEKDGLINLCEKLRLDNIIAIGKRVNKDINEQAQKDHEILKILFREGYITFIPFDTTEEEIANYINFLNGDKPRYS